MKELLTFLTAYEKDIVILLLGGAVGMAGSALVSKLFAKEKIPMYFSSINVLFNEGLSKVGDIQITYQGNDVQNLAVGYMTYWNYGKEPIRAEDIAGEIFLCVPEGFRFYLAHVEKATNPDNEFHARISHNQQKLRLSFRYLNQGDGAVVRYVSDCVDYKLYSVHSPVIGVKSSSERYFSSNPAVFRAINILWLFRNGLLAFLLGVFLSALGLVGVDALPVLLVLWIALVIALAVLIQKTRLTDITRRIPKEFQHYFSGV